MQVLKADTQVVIILGPAVDKSDGVTLESGLVTAMDTTTTGIRISKNGAAWADRAATVVATVYDEGWYRVTLKSGDVDTEGTLDVMYEDATTCLPLFARFQVVNANVYDSLYAAATTDYLQVDTFQLGGVTQSATDLKDFADAGYDPATNKVQGVVLVDTVTTYTGNTPQTADHTAAIADIPTVAEFNARTLLAADYFDPATDAVANVTLCATCTTNTDMRGTDNAGTAAELAKVPKSDGTATWNATALASINTECDTALVDYDAPTNTELNARTLLAADYFDPATDAVANVTLCATCTSNTDMRGTDGANTVVPDAAGTAPTAVEIRQEMDANSVDLDAILLDTGTNLPNLIDDLAIKKNTAFSNFEFLMVLTSDGRTPATGLTVTGQRSIDGGAFAAVSGTIAEVSNGIYQFDALAADTNGDVITWRFISATADDNFVTFKTVA